MAQELHNLEVAFSKDPTSDEAFSALADAYRREDRGADLAAVMERRARQIEEVTGAVDLYWEAAQIHAGTEDSAAEIRVLTKAMEVDSSDPRLLERLDQLLTDQELWADLVHLLGQQAELLRARGDRTDPCILGDLEHRSGKIWEEQLGRADEALACYRRAFEADGGNALALEAGRRIYDSLGRWDGSAALLGLEISITGDAGDRARLLRQLGEIQWRRMGQLKEAAQTFSDAQILQPEDDGIQESLGELYSSADYPDAEGLSRAAAVFISLAGLREEQGDHEAAVDYLRRALGTNPLGDDAFQKLEAAYQQDERWEQLERLYAQRIAVAGEQEAATLQMYRADLLLRYLQRVEEAQRCFEAALPFQGPAGEAGTQLLEIYRDRREWAKVVQLLGAQVEACTTLDTQVALMLEMSAILHDRLDDPEGSAHLVHEVMQLQPENRAAQEAYQDYFRRKGDYRNLVNLQRYLADQDRQAGMPAMDICATLEEVADTSERRLGDLEGAVEAWQQIADLHPDTQRSQEALDRLGARMTSWQQKIQALEQEAAEAVSQSQRVQALRRMAKVYFEWQVDPDRTRAILQEILELSPQDEHAMRMQVDICEREADFAGLAEALASQLDGMMTKAERISILRRVGDLNATKLGHPGQALSSYQALLELSPSDYRVQERVLHLLEETEDLEGLVRFLENRAQCSRSMARRVEALKKLCHISEQELSDHGRATRGYEQILTLDPEDREAQEALSSLYRKAGRNHDLLELLKRRLATMAEQPVAPRAQLLSEIARLAEERLDLPGDAVDAYRQRSAILPADHATRDALVRLLGQLGRHQEMVDVLAEQMALADDAEERVSLAFKQADLLEERLDDPAGAAEVLERLLREDAPGDLDAHRRLKELYLAEGNQRRASELAERELSLSDGDPRDRLALALETARMWAKSSGDLHRTMLAYERVLDQDPEHLEAMQELFALLKGTNSFQRLARLGQGLFANLVDPQQQLDLLMEMGELYEVKLHDPEAAFSWYRRAHELLHGKGEAYAQLERLAKEHGLWDDLTLLLLEQRQREQRPEAFLRLTFRVAEICQEEMEDADAAFEELVQGLAMDPGGSEVLPRLEALALTPGVQGRLLEIYRKVAEGEPEPDRRRELLRKEAALAEEALSDPGRALQAVAVLARLEPDLAWLPEEAERLADLADRWEEVLEIHGRRLDRVDSQERLSLLWHIASIHEERAGQLVPAFRAYLQALAIGPEEEITEEHLWRLARLMSGVGGPVGEVTDEGLLMPIEIAGGEDGLDDATQEVDLAEMGLDDDTEMELDGDEGVLTEVGTADMEVVEDAGGIGEEDLALTPVESADMELLAREREYLEEEEGATLELGDDDVLSTELDQIRSKPPRPPEPAIDPWAELAEAYRDLPASSPPQRIVWLLREVRTWRDGAGDMERALGVLAEAAAIDPEQPEVVEALESLCRGQERLPDLIRIYADSVERATDGGQLLRLELKVSRLLLEVGRDDEAERHLLEALELDPSCAEAEELVTALLERLARTQDLASLLARQLRSLERTLDNDELGRRLLELADLFQVQLEQPEEAVRYLARLCRQPGGDRQIMLRLANLYQDMAEWPELVQLLEQISQRSLEEDDPLGSMAALHRLARVQREELELPDRAMEVYQRLLEQEPGDRAALQVLAELYEAHQRREDLLALLQRWLDVAGEDASEARPLLVRLAQLVSEEDLDSGVSYLQRARAMGQPSSELDEELTALLLQGGRGADAAELLEDRLALARDQGAEAAEEAGLLVSLAEILDTGLDRAEDAWGNLEQALALAPDELKVLQAAAQFHWRHEAWPAYADALERIIDVAPGEVDVDDSLMVAGHVLENSAADPVRARQLYERVLERSADHMPALDAVIRLCGRSEGVLVEQLLRRKEALVEEPRAKAGVLSALADARLGNGASPSEAEELFQRALELCDDLPAAVDGLSRLLVDQDRLDAARLLLEDALTRLSGGTVSGLLGMRLGEVYQRQGRHGEAFTFLLEAHRKDPDDPMLRIAVGLNRYQLERWREVLDYLDPLLAMDRTSLPREDLAEALFAGGRSAVALDRLEKGREFLEAALAADPEHDLALTELAFVAMDQEDWKRAGEALDRQLALTEEPGRRGLLLRMLGDLRRERFGDPVGAARYYEELHGALGDDDATRLQVLPVMLPVLKAAGRHEAAARVAEDLARVLDEPRQGRDLLLTAAGQRHAAGQADEAAARYREVIQLDPACGEAVEGLSAYLLDQGDYEDAAQLAGGYVTGKPPAPTDAARARRGRLLHQLAQAFRAQNKLDAAAAALEEALEIRGDDLDLLEELGEIYGQLPDVDPDAALLNHRRILAIDGTRGISLRALALAAMRGEAQQAHALYQSLALLGELDGPGEAFLAGYCTADLDAERPYSGQLIEEDREALYTMVQPPAMEELFQLLWAQSKTIFPRDPGEVDLSPEAKVPPMDGSPPALAFTAAARALGRSGAQLFLVDPEHPLCAPTPRVVAMAVPAVVASRESLEGRTTPELLFLLGRAVELTGTPGVLAAGMEPEQFVQLMLRVLRAFHARHMRGRKDLDKAAHEDVSVFRRALPFKVARRLGDIFRELGSWPFDSARWRQAAWHGANRAGLLLCGDLDPAARLILQEEGLETLDGPEAVRRSPVLRDLISFSASEAYPGFRKRLLGA